LPFAFGIAREARLLTSWCARSPRSRYATFLRERDSAKFRLGLAEPSEIKSAGVVGAGTMGTGIAITFATAASRQGRGSNDDAVTKAKETVFGMFKYQVDKGKITPEQAWKLGQSITFTDEFSDLADADVVSKRCSRAWTSEGRLRQA